VKKFGRRDRNRLNGRNRSESANPSAGSNEGKREASDEVRVGRRTKVLAPGVEQLEGSRVHCSTRGEDEGSEGCRDPMGVLEVLESGGRRECVLDSALCAVGNRARGVDVRPVGDGASVLGCERDDGDVDFDNSIGTGDSKVGSELGAGNKGLDINTVA
jgi:hypothetical protein